MALFSVDVIANDSDRDVGDLLHVSAASMVSATIDANGAAIALTSASVGFNGSRVSFDPGSDFDFLATGETATVVIQYSATDDAVNALSDTSTLTLTITGTNDGPVAAADSGQTTENNAVTVDVLANDNDPDLTDKLSVSSASVVSVVRDADGSQLTLASAGLSFLGSQVTFDPGSDFDFLAEGETATVVISYDVSDDDNAPLTDSGTLTLQITGTNDWPEARADSGSTTENSVAAFDVLVNDNDVDAGTVLRVSDASVLSMTADINGAAITLTSASVGFSDTRVTFNPGSDFRFPGGRGNRHCGDPVHRDRRRQQCPVRYQHFDPDSHRRQ